MFGNVDVMFAKLKDNVTEKIRTTLSKSEYVQKFSAVITDEKWGPLVPDMDELVSMYPHGYQDFLPEMQARLDNRAINWRKCYKTLLLIDHFLRCLPYQYLDDLRAFRSTLNEIAHGYHYTDSQGVDRGTSVRERAKKILEVMNNESLLHEERQKAEKMRRTLSGGATGGIGGEGVDTRFQGQGANARYEGFGGGAASHERSSSDLDFNTPTHSGPSRTTAGLSAQRREQEEADHRLAQILQAEEEARVARASANRGQNNASHNDDEFGSFVDARTHQQTRASNHSSTAAPAADEFGGFVSTRAKNDAKHHHSHQSVAAGTTHHAGDEFGAFVQSRGPQQPAVVVPPTSTTFFSTQQQSSTAQPTKSTSATVAPSIDDLFGPSPTSPAPATSNAPKQPDAAMGQMLDLFSGVQQPNTNPSLNQQSSGYGQQQRAW